MGDYTCDECGDGLTPVSNLGGDACTECQIFYAPYGFDSNWEVR